MASYVTPKVEFSIDPLSDTTPAWTDITQYVQYSNWFSGKQKDLDGPEAGGAQFVLKNLQRRFEPEYTAGAYYPNIKPGRRFRITLTSGGVNYAQGVYYAREWKVDYPDRGSAYSTVTVSCSDGFWRLANDTLPTLSPPASETYSDVVAHDNPVAFYHLADPAGTKMTADTGPEGFYRSGVALGGTTNPVLGDDAPAPIFASGSYARAKLDDSAIFADAGQFTMECVARDLDGNSDGLLALPWNTANGVHQAELRWGTGTLNLSATGGSAASYPGPHHFCGTWDGSVYQIYVDGVLNVSATFPFTLLAADTSDFLYIHTTNSSKAGMNASTIISSAAFYDYALTAQQVSEHATAALSRGYPAQTAGTRVAALATDPLWSTAGIPAGTITVAPRFQHGQATIDEIVDATNAELPGSIFYFNDAGNPAYASLEDTWTSSATFGDGPGEVDYDQIDLAYDDDLYNTANVSGEGLDGATRTDTQSISDYGVRGVDQTSLPITSNVDARLLAQTYVDRFSQPMFRCESISLNGADPQQRLHILQREVGDTIRVRRRGEGGTPIDIITRILRKEKSLDVNGDLRCTWSLARGFNATLAQWHLNVTGFGELGQTTTLA